MTAEIPTEAQETRKRMGISAAIIPWNIPPMKCSVTAMPPIPQRMPKGIPMAEITPASYSTDRRSWPRVAPTERNSPNCRVRSETEMEKAL